MSKKLWAVPAALLALLCLLCVAACAEETQTMSFTKLKEALTWVEENQPQVLDLGKTKLSFDDVVQVKAALPEGAELRFSLSWHGHTISSDMEEITFSKKGGQITAQFLRDLISLCPKLRMINTQNRRWLTNDVFLPLVDEHPEIDFQWIIRIRCYYVPSTATAFSTLKGAHDKIALTSEECELLRYAPHLKALDLGHNNVTTLDFLKYFPEMRILILALNNISDISILSTMPDLEYVELFNNPISDISALADHTKLVDLNLSLCPITDFSPLDSCTALERLWLNKIKIGSETLEAIQAAHPDTQISHTSNHETSNGWRSHWRYKQYYQMFLTNTWKEFEPPKSSK